MSVCEIIKYVEDDGINNPYNTWTCSCGYLQHIWHSEPSDAIKNVHKQYIESLKSEQYIELRWAGDPRIKVHNAGLLAIDEQVVWGIHLCRVVSREYNKHLDRFDIVIESSVKKTRWVLEFGQGRVYSGRMV